MLKRKLARCTWCDAGLLIAISVAAFMLLGAAGPASAQLFDFGFGRPSPRQAPPAPSRGFGGGFFAPFQRIFPGGPQQQQQFQQQQPQRSIDYSRAPTPEKREGIAERNVLVLGDAMADWLAYGLEDAFIEQPDMGVIRKHKTASGLMRYQPKGEPSDWAAAAKGILATEKPDAIVVMLGLNDRAPIYEIVEKGAAKNSANKKTEKDKKDNRKANNPAAATKSDDAPADPEQNADDQADGETPSIVAPERSARSASGVYDFREDRWVELYSKKIEELIAVLKSKGVPVVWVGLPAVRGPKATSDMLFLDALYREAAGKAGITYVDVWDGFVDEAGRFMPQGPDFEGQIRKLRTDDGVFFTKAGARKLAHYVEREIMRLLAARSTPVALPSDPGIPDANVRPGGPAPRPLAGPIVPLVASSVGTNELLGGPGTRPASVDALAARTLVKGEPLAAPAGRADDSAWPRREVGRLDPGKDAPIASQGDSPAPKAAANAEAAAQARSQSTPLNKRAARAVPPPGSFGFNGRPPTQQPATCPRILFLVLQEV